MIETEKISQILARMAYGKQIRSWWEANLWNPVVELLCPQMGPMLSGTYQNQGDKRGSKAYVGDPEWALDVLVSGMHSGLTPDNYKWLKRRLVPSFLNDIREVKVWLEETEEIAAEVLQSTNFHEETKQMYRQGASFGTGIKWREKDPLKVIRFEVLKLTDCIVLENRQGQVDTLFRECKWTARNAYKEWGDKCSEAVKSAARSGGMDQLFDFVHAVVPRDDFELARDDRKRDTLNMEWAEFWIDPSNKNVLAEGGFKEFPASVWRWEKVPGDFSPYGRGPGIKALQDMGMINAQEKLNALAGELTVRPSMAIPDDGFDKFVDLNPGGRNRWTGQRQIHPINQTGNLPYAIEMQKAKQEAINRRFHVEAFLMISDYSGSADRTVIEIMERKQEKLQILGPMLGTQKIEHLDADGRDIFRMLAEAGRLPQPPDVVLQLGQDIVFDFDSPLLVALRKNESSAITRVWQVGTLISQAKGGDPEVFDNLDPDYSIRTVAEREGAPMKMIVDERVRDGTRKKREIQQAQLAAMQQGMAAVQAAQQLGQVSTKSDEPNLLTDVAGMSQQ
jgi:hypothetical protein